MERFYKIDNFLHHGYPVYYATTEEPILVPATNFNDNTTYYYKPPDTNETPVVLGKFIRKGKINVQIPSCDYDYDAYYFENGLPIYSDKSKFIYSSNLPNPKENDRNLLPIANFTYLNYPIYVHCVKEKN